MTKKAKVGKDKAIDVYLYVIFLFVHFKCHVSCHKRIKGRKYCCNINKYLIFPFLIWNDIGVYRIYQTPNGKRT